MYIFQVTFYVCRKASSNDALLISEVLFFTISREDCAQIQIIILSEDGAEMVGPISIFSRDIDLGATSSQDSPTEPLLIGKGGQPFHIIL